jgi:hypothetical protein
VAEIRRARQAIPAGICTVQLRGLGLGIVELLGACPTNWQVTPVEALEFIEQVMLPVYPLGEFKVAAEPGGVGGGDGDIESLFRGLGAGCAAGGPAAGPCGVGEWVGSDLDSFVRA